MRFVDMRNLLTVLILALILGAGSATAREKDAALVMDAATGKILYARNASEQRFPASLTKMMTLYILFESIEKGETELYARMNISPEAASQKPTRLGLKPGDVLTVEDAIKALIIRSANDASVAIAEHLSGSEDRFAARMTQKARQLGMTNTTFQNASGLPDLQQQTTAVDLAVLSRRLQTDFPRFYPYFAQRSFTWNGRFYRGHNRLVGNFEGADGLKTGYTRLSGYNLATSASRRGTRLIGIVLGGSSGYNRDIQMAEMLETQFGKLGLGRPPSIVVAMSPLVPDEDEMDGAGSRQIVLESAVDSQPEELAVRPASVNTNAPHLNPVLPRSPSRADTGSQGAPAPVGASMLNGVMMAPVVPDDAAPRSRMSPVSDAKPQVKPQQEAALPPAANRQIDRKRDRDAIAGLINEYAPARRATDRAQSPRIELKPSRAVDRASKTQRNAKTTGRKTIKEAVRTKPATEKSASRARGKTEAKAADNAKRESKKDRKAKPTAAKSEARATQKSDRKAKQASTKAPVRRVASR